MNKSTRFINNCVTNLKNTMAAYLKYLLSIFILIGAVSSDGSLFANPVLDSAIGRAYAVKIEPFYYMAIRKSSTELEILKSPFLTDFRNAERRTIFKAPPGYTSVWATSFFRYNDEVYLYFCAISPAGLYQMYVIQSENPTDLLDQWSAPTRLLENIWDEVAINAAVLQHQDQLYLVLTSQINGLSLYIAKMTSPSEVVSPVNLLRQPKEDWEGRINESPSFIYNRNTSYMIFYTLGSGNPNNSLSYMSLDKDLDPMESSNWVSASGPVFKGNPDENVYETRYPSFVTSPDGTEIWLMYVSISNLTNVEPSARVRIDKVEWNKFDGFPEFPQARGNGFQLQLPSGEPVKFTNPILDEHSIDPSICLIGHEYYLVQANDNYTALVLLKNNKLHDFRDAERAVIYTAPQESSGVSGGQIVEIEGKFYIYFHMIYLSNFTQLYVLKAKNGSDLMQGWGDPELLLNGVFDEYASQGNVLKHDNKLYFVWAGVNAAGSRVIYIAPMSTPTQVIEPVVLLKEPKDPWECDNDFCINDYPSALYGTKATFLVYTGNANYNLSCGLSYMSIESGRDPLDVMNWYISPEPVFYRNDAENVYAPCHASFTTSPDGLEDWMLYEASNSPENVTTQLVLRAERITWNSNTGKPIFPKPHGLSHPQPVPSSFKYFTNPVTDDSSLSPGISRIGNFYFLLQSDTETSELILLKSGKLTDFRNSERKIVFSAPEGYSNMGIARMHHVNGKLCIYFSMEELEYFQRIFVVCAQDASNPMGNWELTPKLVAPSLNHSAYHGTILEHNGNTYLTWVTPHPATGFNSISIAKLENANSIVEPIALIRHPFELWECDGGCSNEAPYLIYNGDTAYLVHSVGMACKGGNALTYMSLVKDKDPLNAADWFKAPGKTFTESEDENVFCPSHATFTLSPDGLETWMMYHATDSPHPDAIKTARIEKVTWGENGELVFPNPHGMYHEQLVPGQKKFF